MKMHHFLNGLWDQAQPTHHSSSLSSSPPTAVCKRQRCSLAPKMAHNSDTSALASFHLNSFTRPHHTAPRTLSADDHHSPAPVEAHPGGTRWNPTQEQIGILEMLYKEGTRTPNTHLIDHITHKLAEYGKIEGKNVFYWFQNHKARERQKQKLEQLGHNPKPKTPHSPPTTVLNLDLIATEQEEHVHKRRCRRWTLDRRLEEEGSGWRTLQLFPLRPEGKMMENQ